MKKVKIVFQGDSITDADRDRTDCHDLGKGYSKCAAELLAAEFADVDFEFINLGISGNRTSHLLERLNSDAIELQPDVISILIGINDISPCYDGENTFEQVEATYRTILERIKNETNAKIVVIAPYLLDAPTYRYLGEGFAKVSPIVRKLADEYADLYIPLDEYFDEALKEHPEDLYYSNDGVHPNDNGIKLIAEKYTGAVAQVIEKIKEM